MERKHAAQRLILGTCCHLACLSLLNMSLALAPYTHGLQELPLIYAACTGSVSVLFVCETHLTKFCRSAAYQPHIKGACTSPLLPRHS